MKIYNLTNDYLFRKIFMEEEYLKILLLNLFNVKVETIKYLNPKLVKANKNKKVGIVDLLLEIDGKIVILELQNLDEHNFKERLLFYSLAIIHNHCLKRDDNYEHLKSIKVYAIINYNLYNDNEIINQVNLKRKNKKFTDKLEYKIIDITKIDENDKKSKYYEIINLFKNNNLEKLKQIIKKEEYQKILKQIENYNKNEEEYKKMEDIYEMMMNETVDYRAVYKDGINIGYERGKSEGITSGILQEKSSIAKKLLKQKVDINIIANATNLSIKEINALK